MKVHNRQNQRRIRALDRRLAYEAKGLPEPCGEHNGEKVYMRQGPNELPHFRTESGEAKRALAARREIANLQAKIVLR